MTLARGPWVLLACAATAVCGSAALGQQQYQPPPISGSGAIPGVPRPPAMLERLDPSRQDVGPMADSLREVDFMTDLRNPTGFANVYRLPGRPDLLMRSSGALHAIFPQSVYVPTQRGLMPVVPAGTIYAIGDPGRWSLPQESMTPSMSPPNVRAGDAAAAGSRSPRRDDRIDTLLASPAPAPDSPDAAAARPDEAPPRRRIMTAAPPEPATFLKTIATDEEYRAKRLAELMRQAAAAQQYQDQRTNG